jgi:hypothetical protein
MAPKRRDTHDAQRKKRDSDYNPNDIIIHVLRFAFPICLFSETGVLFVLIFFRRKVPGQTGARTRDLRQHRRALNTNAVWHHRFLFGSNSPFLRRSVLVHQIWKRFLPGAFHRAVKVTELTEQPSYPGGQSMLAAYTCSSFFHAVEEYFYMSPIKHKYFPQKSFRRYLSVRSINLQ